MSDFLPITLERLAQEVELSREIAVRLEQSLFGADRKERAFLTLSEDVRELQDLDLLIQMLSEITNMLNSLATEGVHKDELHVKGVIEEIRLKKMKFRMMGKYISDDIEKAAPDIF